MAQCRQTITSKVIDQTPSIIDTDRMTMTSAQADTQREPPPLARLLKGWRERRKCSQLALALEAGVSQRHLSFVESGRAHPSRDMILALAEALDVPLRERNLLLHAGGFAPLFQQRSLDDGEMSAVRQALEMTLKHHEPFPAVVVDRLWNMQMGNACTDRFIGLLGDVDEVWRRVDPSGGRNVLRMTFHPEGMQPLLRNWEQVATLLLARLQREAAADPTHEALQTLYRDLCQLPSVSSLPAGWRAQGWTTAPPPTLNLELAMGEATLKVFTMISTFGTALDITADELRLETFFPADDFSKAFIQQLAAQPGQVPPSKALLR